MCLVPTTLIPDTIRSTGEWNHRVPIHKELAAGAQQAMKGYSAF